MTTEAPNEIKALLTNEAIQDNSQDVIASLSNKLKSLEEKKNLMNYVKQGLNTLEQS
ncbi:MAG: hypothetical protein LBG59_09440 [Candidatus Peribacteria bacterium]|jgi:hypothetical protein|nr:hypothetical protein [Candidatus Peribacteria bacterium]